MAKLNVEELAKNVTTAALDFVFDGKTLREWIDILKDYRSNDWISVEDRLPESGKLVLFIPESNWKSVYVGKLHSVGKGSGVLFEARDSRYSTRYYAKWWMPLPEPPKEG